MSKEYMFALLVLLLVSIMCLLFGIVCGTESQKGIHRSLLVEKGICKYELCPKTGKTELVIIATGKPFYGEEK